MSQKEKQQWFRQQLVSAVIKVINKGRLYNANARIEGTLCVTTDDDSHTLVAHVTENLFREALDDDDHACRADDTAAGRSSNNSSRTDVLSSDIANRPPSILDPQPLFGSYKLSSCITSEVGGSDSDQRLSSLGSNGSAPYPGAKTNINLVNPGLMGDNVGVSGGIDQNENWSTPPTQSEKIADPVLNGHGNEMETTSPHPWSVIKIEPSSPVDEELNANTVIHQSPPKLDTHTEIIDRDQREIGLHQKCSKSDEGPLFAKSAFHIHRPEKTTHPTKLCYEEMNHNMRPSTSVAHSYDPRVPAPDTRTSRKTAGQHKAKRNTSPVSRYMIDMFKDIPASLQENHFLPSYSPRFQNNSRSYPCTVRPSNPTSMTNGNGPAYRMTASNPRSRYREDRSLKLPSNSQDADMGQMRVGYLGQSQLDAVSNGVINPLPASYVEMSAFYASREDVTLDEYINIHGSIGINNHPSRQPKHRCPYCETNFMTSSMLFKHMRSESCQREGATSQVDMTGRHHSDVISDAEISVKSEASLSSCEHTGSRPTDVNGKQFYDPGHEEFNSFSDPLGSLPYINERGEVEYPEPDEPHASWYAHHQRPPARTENCSFTSTDKVEDKAKTDRKFLPKSFATICKPNSSGGVSRTKHRFTDNKFRKWQSSKPLHATRTFCQMAPSMNYMFTKRQVKKAIGCRFQAYRKRGFPCRSCDVVFCLKSTQLRHRRVVHHSRRRGQFT